MQTIAELCARLGARFEDVEQVGKTIARFTRKEKGEAFALYYVDVGTALPKTSEELSAYQDRVIGARYFDGKKSLQWSNYLYFVISADSAGTKETRLAKILIESDRIYARKYVVVESELDAALEPPQLSPSASPPEANVLPLWLTKLENAGLDDAVLSNKGLPSRLEQIENTVSVAPASPTASQSQQSAAQLPFLKSIKLTTYREFPKQREYDFGSVNLIVGVNGTGKTSLLEAIELLYCGRNNRNPDAHDDYCLAAKYADGTDETVCQDRPPQWFRNCNLQWYGQAETKTNKLFASFALYNFLDTDAAVRLTNSTADLEDNLSNLLVGSEASKIWREIGRVLGAVEGKLRELRPLEEQIKDELVAIEVRLNDAAAVKQESDSIFARLEDILRRLEWEVPAKEMASDLLLESLSELTSLTQQAAAFTWAEAPVSIGRLTAYSSDTQKTIEKAEEDAIRLEVLRTAVRKMDDAAKRCKRALPLIDELKRSVNANVLARGTELRACQDTVAAHTELITGFDEALLNLLDSGPKEVTVAAFVTAAEAARTSAQCEVKEAKQKYEAFTRLRQQSVNLAQQLRDIAEKLLEGATKPDECPLCHTQFDSEQLTKHMHSGVDQHVESSGQLLLAQSRRCEETLNIALVTATAANWLTAFCSRAGLGIATTVDGALARLGEVRRTLVEAEQRREELTKELEVFEAQGMSSARMSELAAALADTGYPLLECSKTPVEQVRAEIERDCANAVATIKEARLKRDALQRSLEQILRLSDATPDGLNLAVSRLKEQRVVAERLLSKLVVALGSFPWPKEGALSGLTVEVGAVRTIATELQAAVGREQQAKATSAKANIRRSQINEQLSDLAPRIARFITAQEALVEIQEKHSLRSATDAALKRNRAGIEAIFSRIHSPAEFVGLGRDLSSLVRKNGEAEVTLNQVSTGQRAAFALSIFLSQNSQLRSAPRVILIDDPVAHIDDMNALSFLDYLREVALSESRQIFFATASEKLATLFHRKFDFLGDEFRRHDLHR